MSTKRHKTVFNIISQPIKKDFALVNHTGKSGTEQLFTDSDILEIPELKQGISEIKTLITKQLEKKLMLTI
jgi:hypothetical protein